MKPKVGEKKLVKCQYCEQYAECTYLPDPYLMSVYKDDKPLWQCPECLTMSQEEVKK